MINPDRRVHGRAVTGEIVRYERAGKWYLEWPDGNRIRLRLADAASMAAHPNDQAEAYLGVPGGRSFDAAVRRFQETRRQDAQ